MSLLGPIELPRKGPQCFFLLRDDSNCAPLVHCSQPDFWDAGFTGWGCDSSSVVRCGGEVSEGHALGSRGSTVRVRVRVTGLHSAPSAELRAGARQMQTLDSRRQGGGAWEELGL